MTVYEIITTQIVTALEQGTVPWRKPWRTAGAPMNLVSKRPYRGINVLLLTSQGFGSPYWLTLKQANGFGGRVRAGEKSTVVVFWKWNVRKEKDEETGEDVRRSAPILRYYRVFNVEQCEGTAIPDSFKPAEFEPIEACEQIVATMPKAPVIEHGGNVACYSPRRDVVSMPKSEAFDKPAEYYSTLFHELGHSTGHLSRLNRKGVAGVEAVPAFGSPDYSQEELVAEMTAAFLCGEAGVAPTTLQNSAAYLASWLRTLKADPRMVVIAGAQAQKAADFILDRKSVAEETGTEAVA